MANLLDEASILLTPTAYDNGRMLAVKPEIALGVDLADGWTFTSGWNTFGGGTSVTNSTTFISESGQGIYTGLGLVAGKKYKILISGTQPSGGYLSIKAGTTGTSFGNITEQSFDKIIYVTPSTVTGVGNSFYIRLASHAVNTSINITKLQIQEDLSGDFTFSRNSAATRVNAQGLVENVQILSSNLVSNGDFSQEGVQEVSNGSFSQEGAEQVVNGDFSTDSDWNLGSGWDISGGSLNALSTTGIAFQNFSGVVVGKTYKATITVESYTSGILRFKVGNDSYQNISSNLGIQEFYFTASSTGGIVIIPSSAYTGSITNISVKEVGQDWSLGSNWSIGENKITSNASGLLQQSTSELTVGKTYKTSFEITEYTSGGVKLYSGSGSDTPIYQTSLGTHVVYFVANGNTTSIYSNNFTGSITNISVKEVGQDWTLGTGWSIGDGVANAVDAAFDSQLVYSDNVVANTKYKVSFNVSNYVKGNVRVNIGNVASDTVSSNGNFTFVLTSFISSPLAIQSWAGGSGTSLSVTNISVIEITDDTNLPRINYEGFSYQDSLGSEEVVNGSFSNGLSNWTNNSSWWSIVNGEAYHPASTSMKPLSQSVSTEVGKEYKISVNVNIVSGTPQVFWDKVSGQESQSLLQGLNEIIVTTFKTNSVIYFGRVPSINTEFYIDNVSVKEYLGQEVVPNSGCGSWLLEPQSTNLITQSELFSNAAWTKKVNASITSNVVISPNGTLNSDTITWATSGSATQLYQVKNITGTSQSLSIFIKYISGSGTNFRFSIGTIAGKGINLTFTNNGATLTGVAEVDVDSYKIEDYENNWFRVSFTANYANSNCEFNVYRPLGTGTDVYAIYGAQLESSISYASSYIPTTSGAISTRLQDIATNSGNASLINSEEGVLYFEGSALANDGTNRVITLSKSSDWSNRTFLRYDASANSITYRYLVNGSIKANLVHTLSNATILNKIACKWELNNFKLYVNGLNVGQDLSGSVISADSLNKLNFNDGLGTNKFFGKNKALAVYKTALTDANLRSLTYPSAVATTFDLNFNTIAEDFTFTRGSEATFVNAQGLIQSTASNDAPRLDYSTGAEAFLLEPQSTNLIPYSEDFSQWNNNGVNVTLNQGISPNGNNSANRIEGTLSSQSFSITTSSVSNYTFSMYVKPVNSPFIRIIGGSSKCYFDMTNKTVATNTFDEASIEDVGNGWFRLVGSSSNTANTFETYAHLIDNTSTEFVGSDYLVWGAQVEQQSYPTSYIPTSGASATRNQELCNNATPVINSEEGTLYAEISALANDGTLRRITISDGTTANIVMVSFNSADNQYRSYVISNGSVVFNFIGGFSSSLDFNKIAISYSQNNFALWVNGVEVATDLSGNTPIGLNNLSFDGVNGATPFFGNTKDLKYYPKALADVQLQDLTTL